MFACVRVCMYKCVYLVCVCACVYTIGVACVFVFVFVRMCCVCVSIHALNFSFFEAIPVSHARNPDN